MGGYIQYQPTDPNEGIARLLQLRLLAQDRDERRADRSEQSRINRLREREAVLKLQELERAAREGEIVRGAMAAGVRPGLQAPQGREGRLGVNIPTGFDRAAALQALAQGEGAHMVPDVQAQFAKEDFTQREQALKLTEQLAKLDGEQLKNAKTKADMMGSLAQSVIINPASYPSAKAEAERLGLVQPGQLPEQFTPGMLPQLEMWAKQSMTVKDIIDAEEKARANKAQEGLTKRGQDISAATAKRGQDLARTPNLDELLTPNEAGTLGVPYGTTRRQAQGKEAKTTDERNKDRSRATVSTAVQAVRELGGKVITEKLAIAQRAVAAGRSVDAALGDDPEYRAYQDSRVALAGNLAVLQQGSRPSDADIKAVWLPLVPDAFRDTKASSELKWKLIDQMSGFEPQGGQGPAVGTVENGYRFKGGNPADRNNWEKVSGN